MSDKLIVLELLERLPEEASLPDIANAIRFVDGVRKGVAQADRGELISAEDVRASIQAWARC